jgi:hypothetical protein
MTTVLITNRPGAAPKRLYGVVQRHTAVGAIVLALLSTLSGCSTTPTKDWEVNASSAQNGAIDAYLSGDTVRYQSEVQRMRRTIGATGKTDLLIRAELSLCAIQVASLVESPCGGYLSVSHFGSPAEKAYESFLRGNFEGLKSVKVDGGAGLSALPPLYRAVVDNPSAINNKAFQEAPLSALVASSVLFRRGELGPQGVAQAVDMASDQGWRRPLLAWLGVQEALFKAAGEQQLALGVRRRMDMATK